MGLELLKGRRVVTFMDRHQDVLQATETFVFGSHEALKGSMGSCGQLDRLQLDLLACSRLSSSSRSSLLANLKTSLEL